MLYILTHRQRQRGRGTLGLAWAFVNGHISVNKGYTYSKTVLPNGPHAPLPGSPLPGDKHANMFACDGHVHSNQHRNFHMYMRTLMTAAMTSAPVATDSLALTGSGQKTRVEDVGPLSQG